MLFGDFFAQWLGVTRANDPPFSVRSQAFFRAVLIFSI